VNSTVDVPIENQPQIIASGTGCTYDNNGNLTSDPSRGIRDIEWSETGKPIQVSFVSGEEICYRYATTGEKLSEVFVDTDGRILRRRDICGSYELTDYYPYGIPHTTAYSPEANRRKFGGKEYTSEFGFSSCDFGARLYSPLLCGFDSPDPKATTYTHISPYAYCAADPVNFIDPTGMNPVYNSRGEFLDMTIEGLTGEILIYYGENAINFSSLTFDQCLSNQWDNIFTLDITTLENDALSNIWTDIVSRFEGLQVFDETFSLSTISDGKIQAGYIKDGHWETDGSYTRSFKPPIIRGYGSTRPYENTVENIASSLIVHEWYSHAMKGTHDVYKSHRLAYKNVINFKYLWDKTTYNYKKFVLTQLQYYTLKETGCLNVDPPYLKMYNKYTK
ncbi:MAG: RHS repeat-associated core domain-containing protein, partial [Muribaculaceae bacterium]|nr:RHS repeat-associated core domain-containing protein [Muribaculaceae bacterium]